MLQDPKQRQSIYLSDREVWLPQLPDLTVNYLSSASTTHCCQIISSHNQYAIEQWFRLDDSHTLDWASKLNADHIPHAVDPHQILRLHGIQVIANFREEVPYLEDLKKIINMCGSFLAIQDNHVYFIHKSVKDRFNINASVITMALPKPYVQPPRSWKHDVQKALAHVPPGPMPVEHGSGLHSTGKKLRIVITSRRRATEFRHTAPSPKPALAR